MRAISTNIYLTLQSINSFIPYKRIYLLTWSDASVKSPPRHPLPRTRLELWNITHNIILNTRYPHFVNIWLPDWQHYGLFKSTHQMKLSSHHTIDGFGMRLNEGRRWRKSSVDPNVSDKWWCALSIRGRFRLLWFKGHIRPPSCLPFLIRPVSRWKNLPKLIRDRIWWPKSGTRCGVEFGKQSTGCFVLQLSINLSSFFLWEAKQKVLESQRWSLSWANFTIVGSNSL